VNIDQIKSLAEIVSAQGLTVLELSEGDVRIRLEKSAAIPQKDVVKDAGQPAVITEEKGLPEDHSLNFNNLFEVKSPLVGVFYAAPSPDAEPFTHIGAKVKNGDVLCLIETMKLMNEITAEHEGEIMDVCLKDGDIAEYGQVLFKIL